LRRAAVVSAIIVGLCLTYVPAHLVLIEVGREVVVLRTRAPDGTLRETRLWVVEVERGGEMRRYRAVPVPGPHERIHQLLRKKYGLTDHWVRVLDAAEDRFLHSGRDVSVPVRLEPL
jgi:hypothetical protein